MTKTEAIAKIRTIRDDAPTSLARMAETLGDEGFNEEACHVATATYKNVVGTLGESEAKAIRTALNTLSGWVRRTENDYYDDSDF